MNQSERSPTTTKYSIVSNTICFDVPLCFLSEVTNDTPTKPSGKDKVKEGSAQLKSDTVIKGFVRRRRSWCRTSSPKTDNFA